MTIRRAKNNDIEAITNLLGQVLEIHAELHPDVFIHGTTKYTRAELEEKIGNDYAPIFVADDDGKVEGYAFCVIEDHAATANTRATKTLYVDDLCVDGNCRGKHVGKTLYDYVIAFAKSIGCYNVTLNVWEGNEARRFYEKMGMKARKTMMETVL
ncbi:MAG: N-acetyltransferase family protein [Christensenellales bacterium]